jgi:hypothetical protein
MTKIVASKARALLLDLVGRNAERARVRHGSTLLVDFGPEREFSAGSFRGEWHLVVFGAAWRLETESHVLLTSEAERSSIERVAEHLDGRQLIRCEVIEPSYSLGLAFEDGVALRTFNLWTDDGAENWMIFMPNGMVLSAEGGALLLVSADSID